MLVRAEAAKAAVPFCPYLVHDQYLALWCAEKGRIESVARPLIRYRIHGGNQTSSMSVFYTIADAPFQMLYLPQAHFWTVNPRRSDSFWKVSGNALRQWGEVWCETIDALPAVYDSDKAAVLKSFDAHIHLFSVRQLVNMKPEGNLSLEKVRRYRPYIDRVTDTPVFWFYFVSIFVNRSLAGDARAIYRKIKKLKTTGA